METDRPSLTAHRVALRRAAHQILDKPVILEDPIALKIIGRKSACEIEASEQNESPSSRRLRAFVVARSKYAEEQLAESIGRGLNQYVILGAGLDTFAYRNPYSSQLRVFEVDHPSSQSWKRKRLEEAEIAIPASVTFVPLDFEKQTLAERLKECGFNPAQSAFFAWLGVTMYLSRGAVMSTIKYIAESTRPGSELIFDFMVPVTSLNPLQQASFYAMAQRVAAIGEPWVTFFEPPVLIKQLKEMGFSQAEDTTPDQINERFFKDRIDGLRVGGLAHLCKATR